MRTARGDRARQMAVVACALASAVAHALPSG